MIQAASPFANRSGRRWWLAAPAVALLAGILVLATGAGSGIDRGLRDVRDRIRQHSASGDIAIVEIDARSLRALDRWPWPRRYHALLVDRLASAQAALIAFDINFEVASNPQDDAALAAALARSSSPVALPTFRQHVDSISLEEIETLPLNLFRDNAFLAGVQVIADPDGLVRRLPLGTETAATPRPSMASLLADAEGAVDELLEIDFAIDPNTIPRLSYIDVLEGRFDPAAVAGKRLFIGGTAADMEDRYAVPLHGVLPGVVVQALAAETIIIGGIPARGGGHWPLLLALAAALAAAWSGIIWRTVATLAVGTVAVMAWPLATEHWLALSFPIAPALACLSVAALSILFFQMGEVYRRRSLIDAPTGLPNGKALLVAAARRPGQIVVARIDRFDALAATLGPDVSARLVRQIADRLSVASGASVHRTDESSLAWLQLADSDDQRFEHRLAAVAAAMRAPIDCGRPIDVTVGLGIADPAGGGQSGDAIRQQAAGAALAAEKAVRDRRPFLRFADVEDHDSGWHLSLISELNRAMTAGEVWNAYQPKLDIRTGQICGVETLVRWTHPERGDIAPDRFIPLVEAQGRAAELTTHVFREALADAARWQRLGHDLSVAVNVSATLLEDQEFIKWLADALRGTSVGADRIVIEVTESAAVNDVEQAAAALARWRALGVAISIDDYGTGQSSLGYLQRLPAGELKIDKSFIQNLVDDHRDAIMVRSTVALAHQLGMKVVAEGVENEATLAALGEIGCDVAQGWLIGKPMPADRLETFLARPLSLVA